MRVPAALLALVLASACGGDTTAPAQPAVPGLDIVGADVSSLSAVEAAGGRFSDGGVAGDPIAILRQNGVNYIRLRLFHAPDTTTERVNSLAYDLGLAQRVKQAGLKLLLDVHYSDTWADPGRQDMPVAWQGLDSATLRDTVFAYTRDVVAAFRARGVLPDMIQLGNEVNTGFLWPAGHADASDADWGRYAALLQSARDGVQAALGAGEHVAIMHHVADPRAVTWHMDHLLAHIAKPDVIGVSYYPFWHGDLQTARAALAEAATKYQLPIVIVETAYPWTNDWYDATTDVYHGSPAAGMPPYTPAGQATYIDIVTDLVRSIPASHGAGFFYWEPAWLPSATFGSPMDNMTLFDQHGAALPALARLRPAAGIR